MVICYPSSLWQKDKHKLKVYKCINQSIN